MGHYFLNDENLKSEIVEYKVSFNNEVFKFKTDNGVFSKGELDYGTYLLLKTVLSLKLKGNLLDLGCGYGAIGIVLNKIFGLKTLMVDINKRAIHLANLNIKNNNCENIQAILSDGYSLIENRFDYIVTNPPIRIGKEKLYELIINSKNYLNNNGRIYLVIRKEQGAKTFIRDMEKYYKVEILEKSKGFFIICLK